MPFFYYYKHSCSDSAGHGRRKILAGGPLRENVAAWNAATQVLPPIIGMCAE